jgi:Flp pilus assembly protein TadG
MVTPTLVVRRSRRGANAVEFALTFPLFLVLVLGFMDYGYLFAIQAGLDSAVSMACRQGAMTDPGTMDPVLVASAQLTSRSNMFCLGKCTQSVVDLQSGAYAPPNRTLRCQIDRTMTAITGFSGVGAFSYMYPNTINSVSYYRLEWQR